MKKLILGFTVLLTTLILIGCQASALSVFAFDTDEEIISFSALASTTLLSNTEVVQPLSAQGVTPLEATTVEEEIVDTIQPYLDMVEKFLGNNQGLSVQTDVSDREGYETMMTFQTVDMLGMPTTYTIYYNLTALGQEFDEEEFQIDGILVYSDIEYTIYGKKEIDQDEEEIKFRASIDEFNYVESSYEIEENEYKFIFRTYSEGVMTSESKIKVETEDFELKIKMEYQEGLDYGDYVFKYESEDGENILKIEFESQIDGISKAGEIKVLIEVDPVSNETTYAVYVKEENESEEHRFDRDRRDDDDDDEDEEESEASNSHESEESEPEDSDEIESTDDQSESTDESSSSDDQVDETEDFYAGATTA